MHRTAKFTLHGILLVTALAGEAIAQSVSYDLTIAEGTITINGEPQTAMTINGGVPGPVLRFTEGDDAVINVTNQMSMPTSIHWHGLLVPPDMDGVPFISFPPIQPGATFNYRIPIRQSGTYWYHSHSEMQEQLGVYGSIVISPKDKNKEVDHDHVLMLSDWTNEDPDAVLRTLRRGSEYYGVKKKTAQSLLGAAKTGMVGKWLKREAMRMPPMDLADVAYDAFLINGKAMSRLDGRPGETVRLRIIDGSASTFFHLTYAGGPMRIVAADGQEVEAVVMKTPLLIGVAETYDVLVKIPGEGAYEFRATAHDGSGYASVWIGLGEEHAVEPMPAPFVYDTMEMFGWKEFFALTPAGTMGMPDHNVKMGVFDEPGMNMMGMNMGSMDQGSMDMKGKEGGSMAGMDHGSMDMSEKKGSSEMMDMEKGLFINDPAWYDFLLREDAANQRVMASDSAMSKERPFAPYKKLRAKRNTRFAGSAPRRDVRLTLDGDMNRYVWFMNNEPLLPTNDIEIKKGEVVRFHMINRTMMHHPMHLHGHFFRVINGQGDHSPLKHTIDVEPMSTTVIEFNANEVGDWFFHCHLLYHMDSGMARVVRYDGYNADPATAAIAGKRYNQHTFVFARADVLSNMTQGSLTVSNLRNDLMLSWEAGWEKVDGTTWESEITYGRYINRFLTVFGGVYLDGVDGTREDIRPIVGLDYLLPLNFHAAAWVDDEGEARVTLEREIMLTPRLGVFGEAEYDTIEGWSYQGGASYLIKKNISATALWDTDYGVGGGVTLRF
jgi:FtsP/CotA-like multicopper oxidase with cupredoxin domain